MTRKVGFWSEFLGLAFFCLLRENFGKKEEKRAQSDNTNERDRHTHKRARNVFIQSDKAGVGSPQMVGFGETRADDESFGEVVSGEDIVWAINALDKTKPQPGVKAMIENCGEL